jgi:uncharacterized C2H2 Zn-finger protein
VSRTAEALRVALDEIAADQYALECELRRLSIAQLRVTAALAALGEDPEQPSLAELEEFRPADQARVWSEITDQLTAADLPAPGIAAQITPPVVLDTAPLAPDEGVRCPDCGSVFNTQQGMRIHRGRFHKVAAPAPTPPAPAPASAARARGAVVLACTDCDAEFETSQVTDLARHTRQVHGRRPSDAERMPVNPIRGAQ